MPWTVLNDSETKLYVHCLWPPRQAKRPMWKLASEYRTRLFWFLTFFPLFFSQCFRGWHLLFSQRAQRPSPLTCRRVLQELLDLCWGQLCPGHGQADPQLLQGWFDVGLLKVGVEGGCRNSPRGAVGRALHNVNDHFSPERGQMQNICQEKASSRL